MTEYPLSESEHQQNVPTVCRRISPSELLEASLETVSDLGQCREPLLELAEARSGLRPRHIHAAIRRGVVGD